MQPIATAWSVGGTRHLDLQSGALVGVLNVTPDSFSDGGLWDRPTPAIERAGAMRDEGAMVIDVGGESTRPGATPISIEEEAARALPVVQALAGMSLTVSIDTYKPEIARLAVEAGASIVNDVTGFTSPEMIDVVAASDVGVVVMHGRGQALQSRPPGTDPVANVASFLSERAVALAMAGVARNRIAIDPGLGFAKRHEQSLALIAHVDRIAALGFPVMLGASRKGFLKGLARATTWEARDSVTAAITALGFLRGARLFRVHDVARSRDALRMAGAIVASQ